MVTVHGRTRLQGYTGQAEYDTIASVKSALRIPVVANGDIDSPFKARQVLQALGLWNDVRPQLVIGENVAQAAQFASDGNTDGGLIAHSLALAPELGRRGRFVLVPDELHEPLRQRMVLLRNASPAAIRL